MRRRPRDVVDHLFEAVQGPVEIGARDNERRRQANDRVVGFLREHALAEQALAHVAAAREARVDLGTCPQAPAAHFFENRAAQCAQPPQHVGTEHAAALDQSFISNDAQCLKSDGRRERVAAKGRTVRSGRKHVHDLASSDKSRDR